MVVYYKLFDLLKRKNMKISDLRNVISSATVAKINKNQHVSGECIDKICRYLKCQPGDIMEIVETEKEKEIREKGETAIKNMYESAYEMLFKLSDNSDKTLEELWEEYLKTMSEKRKNKPDFQLMKDYIDNRIKESKQEI